MTANKKYYVVWKGYKTGIFDSWEECKKQVEGFTGAKYKSFPTYELALQAFNPQNDSIAATVPTHGLCVDAAYSKNTHILEYRGIIIPEKKVIFHQGPYYDATNNIGEFLAIVHALALCKKHNWNFDIYSDSITAIAWVRNKKANTKLTPTPRNTIVFELITRAEKWLLENTFNNSIYKWETTKWGEIPADFGRK